MTGAGPDLGVDEVGGCHFSEAAFIKPQNSKLFSNISNFFNQIHLLFSVSYFEDVLNRHTQINIESMEE